MSTYQPDDSSRGSTCQSRIDPVAVLGELARGGGRGRIPPDFHHRRLLPVKSHSSERKSPLPPPSRAQEPIKPQIRSLHPLHLHPETHLVTLSTSSARLSTVMYTPRSFGFLNT
ncbi:Hypothetical protein NTJ_08218 [Nesidiocoris tenuis]|uniref:Uncharacterized protein n=1 Tax=Nesidiocoris tenuis TaxID=355587 RepID=A0ABN7ATY3_9HEMI|nr:Hypothetical protein NTJ_08218 [Nesidiocoris tenuis]